MASYKYYNKNAQAFIDRTFELDVTELTKVFLEQIPEGGTILDMGCGSGRDSKFFKEHGYDVYAVDASEMMIEHTSRFLGDRAVLAAFDEYEPDVMFDGIWASASLLHVPEEEMVKTVRRYFDMLKDNGVFHMSFKVRDEHFTKGLRSFTCYDKERLRAMIREVGGLQEISVYTTEDMREDNFGEKWVNGLFKKV